jgi:hypothetical protein
MSLKPKKTGAVRPNSSWEAPRTEFIKMDVNAVFHEETRNGGRGAIGRDNTLDICVAAAGPLQMMDDCTLKVLPYVMPLILQIRWVWAG